MTGPEFRTARKALGYSSRVSIAVHLEVSEMTIQRWETSDRVSHVVELAIAALEMARVIRS